MHVCECGVVMPPVMRYAVVVICSAGVLHANLIMYIYYSVTKCSHIYTL